ncbi:Ig-like domain-containing protein [Candidatus Riflebacteria bacterium]
MRRNHLFFSFLLLSFLFFNLGCSIFSNDDDDPVIIGETATISGKVEFPASAGTEASIRAAIDFAKYHVYINGVKVTLNADGTFSGDVPQADEYEIEVRFAGSGKAVLKAHASKEDEGKEIEVDIKTTAESLAYLAYKEKSGKSDKNFQSFKEIVAEVQETIDQLAETIEKALKSISNIESEDFDLEENEEVKSKTEEAAKKAEEEEEKQASSSTTSTTSSSTTSSTADSTTTTSSSTSSTTAATKPAASLAINDGAERCNSRTVTLNLTGVQGDGALLMSVDGGDFVTLDQAKSHTLSSGDGTKTATVVIKDSLENKSDDITDSIVLDTTLPEVSSTSPANGSEIENLSASITLVFSEDMDPETITATTFISNDDVSGTLSYSDKKLVFTPSTDFSAGATYTFILKKSASDLAANGLAQDYNYAISTKGNEKWASPTIISQLTGEISMADTTNMLSLNDSGKAMAGWIQHDGSYLSVYGSYYDGSTWSTPQLLEDDDSQSWLNCYATSIDSDEEQKGWVFWNTNGGFNSVWGRALTNGEPQGVATLLAGGTISDRAREPIAAMTATGKTVLLYRKYTDTGQGTRYDIYTKIHSGTAWGTAQAVSSTESTCGEHCLSMKSASNKAMAVWQQAKYNSGIEVPVGIFVSTFDGTGWSNLTQLDSDTNSGYPKVAYNGSKAVVSWLKNNNIYIRYYDGSSWGTAQQMTSTPVGINIKGVNRLAINDDGKVILLWQTGENEVLASIKGNFLQRMKARISAAVAPPSYILKYRYYDGSSWSTETDLFENSIICSYPNISYRNGKAIVIWTRQGFVGESIVSELYSADFNGASFASAALVIEDSSKLFEGRDLLINNSGKSMLLGYYLELSESTLFKLAATTK